MKLPEAREQFIQAWGALGTSWGINKAMAQIQAILLISPDPLSTEEIMEQLNISRGNANMNIRALVDWGIVHKVYKAGERKDFFTSEKDIWELARQVAGERKRRELDPVLKMLTQVSMVEDDQSKEVKEFKKMTAAIEKFGKKAASTLDTFVKADQHWFFGLFSRKKK